MTPVSWIRAFNIIIALYGSTFIVLMSLTWSLVCVYNFPIKDERGFIYSVITVAEILLCHSYAKQSLV